MGCVFLAEFHVSFVRLLRSPVDFVHSANDDHRRGTRSLTPYDWQSTAGMVAAEIPEPGTKCTLAIHSSRSQRTTPTLARESPCRHCPATPADRNHGDAVTPLQQVLSSLQAPRHKLSASLATLPAQPGLYAIYGDERAWTDMHFDMPSDDTPMYVGKAEDNMAKRAKTHFGDGRTGSSTVRRSFAALLRHDLALTGIPRNPAKPADFANYGLSPADDAKLTRWMRDHLAIAMWPTDGSRALAHIEAEVLTRWNPALNIAGVDHQWKPMLQEQRRLMTDQARAWRPTSA